MALLYNTNVLDESGQIRIEGQLQFTGPSAPQHIRSFAVSHSTAGLATGVAVWTPQVGDIIYDIGIVLTTAFNGTTPLLDVGTFNGGNVGLFGELAGAGVDGTKLYADVTDNAGLSAPNTAPWLQSAVGSVGAAAGAAYKSTPILVTAANPVLLVASQNGQKGGTATGATVGAGNVYVLLGNPVSF